MAEVLSLMARSGGQLVRISLQTGGSVVVTLDGAPIDPGALAFPLELGAEVQAILSAYIGLVRAGFRLRLPAGLEGDLAPSATALRRNIEDGVSLAGSRAGERRTERKRQSGQINAGKATQARLTQEDGSPVVAAIVALLAGAGRPLATLEVIEALQARLPDAPATTVRSTLHRISRAKTPKIVRTLDGWIPA